MLCSTGGSDRRLPSEQYTAKVRRMCVYKLRHTRTISGLLYHGQGTCRGTVQGCVLRRFKRVLQLAVGILLAAGLQGQSLPEAVGVAIIVMFCLFALGFAW